MSGRQCYSCISRGMRTRSQALRFQLQSRRDPTQFRSLHTTQRRLAATEPAKAEHASPTPNPKPQADAPAMQRLASKLRKQSIGASTTEPYAAYGTTQQLFKSCAAPGDYSASPPSSSSSAGPETDSSTAPSPAAPSPVEALAAGSVAKTASTAIPLKTSDGEDIFYPAATTTWHGRYSLPPTFSTWSHLTILHLYLLQLRIRQFPADHARRWTQNLLDHFFYAAEERMESYHGMTSRGIRSRYLKDLFDQYRGAVVSYDEGVLKGDAVLAAAVWRNVFRGREDVDAVALAEVVGWLRRGAGGLARLDDRVFAEAQWKFGVPWTGGSLVEKESEGVKQPFVDEGKAGS